VTVSLSVPTAAVRPPAAVPDDRPVAVAARALSLVFQTPDGLEYLLRERIDGVTGV
jgi:hypothetical protein